MTNLGLATLVNLKVRFVLQLLGGLDEGDMCTAKHRTQKQANPNNGKGTEEEGVCKVCAVM